MVGRISSRVDTFVPAALTLSSAIEAGVSTIFVGLGEDPQVLAIRAPELFGVSRVQYLISVFGGLTRISLCTAYRVDVPTGCTGRGASVRFECQ